MSSPNKVEITQVNEVTTVEITTQGPQGPAAAGFEFRPKTSNCSLTLASLCRRS